MRESMKLAGRPQLIIKREKIICSNVQFLPAHLLFGYNLIFDNN